MILVSNICSTYQCQFLRIAKSIFYFIVYNLEKSTWTEACYQKLMIGNCFFDAKYLPHFSKSIYACIEKYPLQVFDSTKSAIH